MRFLRALVAVFMLAFLVAPAWAGNAVLAAGAGYKKMVNALNAAYSQESGHSLDLLFGNMARVTMLARQSGKVGIVLGDALYMDNAKLSLASRQVLGRGRLVLAFARSGTFSGLDDLDTAGRIALPDVQKAIYGKAAREFLQSSGRLPAIKPRLVEVSTVPQVFSYLATNEVDMGFMNLTHTLNVLDKIGGYVVIDEKAYSPITIIAGLLENAENPAEAMLFLDFLKSPRAQSIIREHGL